MFQLELKLPTSRRSLWIPLGFQRFLVGSYGFKDHLRVPYVGQCLHEGVPVVLQDFQVVLEVFHEVFMNCIEL